MRQLFSSPNGAAVHGTGRRVCASRSCLTSKHGDFMDGPVGGGSSSSGARSMSETSCSSWTAGPRRQSPRASHPIHGSRTASSRLQAFVPGRSSSKGVWGRHAGPLPNRPAIVPTAQPRHPSLGSGTTAPIAREVSRGHSMLAPVFANLASRKGDRRSDGPERPSYPQGQVRFWLFVEPSGVGKPGLAPSGGPWAKR